MCGMALVHSRAERVYFEQGSMPNGDVLEIMYNMSLNHKIDLLVVQDVKEIE
jgi:tRNA(Arg) A34 adenosine deaminase TadA